jgi:hypothetical protein
MALVYSVANRTMDVFRLTSPREEQENAGKKNRKERQLREKRLSEYEMMAEFELPLFGDELDDEPSVSNEAH